MKKTSRLRLKQLMALILAGALTAGSVGTPVFGADLGDTAIEVSAEEENVAEEATEETDNSATEESGAGSVSEDNEGSIVETYTVMLDANGGYFVNEWDDTLNESVERTEILNKVIPAGETLKNIVPMMEQENAVVTFLGWSLESDGELVSLVDEEYIPVDNCVLYAVWEIEETEEVSLGGSTNEDAGVSVTAQEEEAGYVDDEKVEAESGDTETGEDTEATQESEDTEETETAQKPEDSKAEEETDSAQKYDDTEAKDSSQESEDMEDVEDIDTAQELAEDTNTASTQEAIYSDEKGKETVSTKASNAIVDSGYCGVDEFRENAIWTLYDNGTLVISGVGVMEYYDQDRLDVTKVIINEGIVNVGFYSFVGYKNLRSVELPSSLSYIESSAFSGCSSLEEITIPSGVTNIGEDAFYGCSSLEEITIPSSVTNIGGGAFGNCTSLTNMLIPDGVKIINWSTFENCTSLKNVNIPSGVKTIDNCAFKGCSSLANILIPSSVSYIGVNSFYECTSLTSFTIPEGVEVIVYGSFFGCTRLEEVVIPSSISSIDKYAFQGCSSLTNVVIPEGVKYIRDGAFYDCSSLKSITLPKSITYIGKYVFGNCPKISEINVADVESWIKWRESLILDNGYSLYINNELVEDLVIPSGITSVIKELFSKCNSLKNVTIPENVNSIEEEAFYECSSLKSVSIAEGLESIGEYSFYDCTNLTSIIIPFSVTSIDETTFYGCDNLTIYGYSGSYAESYAEENWIPFVPISVALFDPGTGNVIDRLYYAAGSFYYNNGAVDVTDWTTTFYDYVKAKIFFPSSYSNLTFTVELPDGLSFDPKKLVTKKTYNNVALKDNSYEIPFIYLLYSDKWASSNSDDFQILVKYTNNSTGNTETLEPFLSFRIKQTVDQASSDGLDSASFSTSNQQRNKQIALLSAYLSELMENTDKTSLKKNILSLLRDTYGFSVIKYTHPNGNLGSYLEEESVCAKKTVLVNGIIETIVVYAIQGSDFARSIETVEDFLGNLDFSGKYSFHDNFMKASHNNRVTFLNYCDYALDLDYSKDKLLITGHSRGGAIANLVAKQIIDMKGEECFSPDNIFCYTFAAANVDKAARDTSGTYGQIYNIINYADIVPFVPGFGLDKYGHNLVFNIDDHTADDIKALARRLSKRNAGSLRGAAILKRIKDNAFLPDIYADHSMSVYIAAVKRDQFSATPFFTFADQSDSLFDTKWESIIKTDVAHMKATASMATAVSNPFIGYLSKVPFIKNLIKCPVDVDVIDGTGTVVCSIVNDSIELCNADDIGVVIIDDKKTISYPEDAGYSIKITGYDEGTMDYYVYETDSAGNIIKTTEFAEVPIENGGEIVPEDTNDTLVLNTNSGNITADEVLSGNEITKAAVNLSCTEDGVELLGNGTYAIGETVPILAYSTNDEVPFEGWYDEEGNCVSTSEFYAFFVDKDTSLTARYSVDDGILPISDSTIEIEKQTYTGEELKPEPVVFGLDGTRLTADTDYIVSYSNNINVGTASVNITGIGNYGGITTSTFEIEKASQSINASNLSLIYPKTGTITASGNIGKLTYKSNNTAVATVDSAGKVTAKGAGKGTITITAAATSNYNTAKKTITVTVAKAAQSITAKAAAPSVAVGKTNTVSITGNKGTKSFKSSDTTIATVEKSTGKVTAKKVGTVKITATSAATANYNAASKTVTIKVVPAATSSLKADNQATGIRLTWKKVTGANGYKIYRGSTLIKTITSGNTVTFADTKANTNGTKYTYKVVAKAATGDSTLSKSVAVYRVARPAVSSVTNSASKKMTVKWGKNAKATGYQIQYSQSKTFASGNKAVNVAGASAVSKVIGSLTKSKTYYVRIRTYKTVGSAKYWSVWSAAKSVKISK